MSPLDSKWNMNWVHLVLSCLVDLKLLLVIDVLVSFPDIKTLFFGFLIHQESIHEHVIVNSIYLVKFRVCHKLKRKFLNEWTKKSRNTTNTHNRAQYTIFWWRISPLVGYISLVQLHNVGLCISLKCAQFFFTSFKCYCNLFQWV